MGETNKPNQPDSTRGDEPGKSQQQGSPGQRQNPNQQGGGMGPGQAGGKQPGQPDKSSPDRGRKASDEEEGIQERKSIDDELESPRGEPGLQNPVRVPGDDSKNPVGTPGE